MKVYISGPMSGLPEFNYPAFNAVAEHLRAIGHEPINPARPHEGGWAWTDFMRRALCDLSEAEGIWMLPGWQTSRGANLEDKIARALFLERLDPPSLCRCGHGAMAHMFGLLSDSYQGCDLCDCMEMDDQGQALTAPGARA